MREAHGSMAAQDSRSAHFLSALAQGERIIWAYDEQELILFSLVHFRLSLCWLLSLAGAQHLPSGCFLLDSCGPVSAKEQRLSQDGDRKEEGGRQGNRKLVSPAKNMN